MKSEKSIYLLLVSTLLGTFGSSLFWTGFPIFYSSIGAVSHSLSGIYAFATFGTLLFTLIGGLVSDIGNYKKLSVVSSLVSLIFISVFFTFAHTDFKGLIVYLLPLMYFNLSLGTISEATWLLKKSDLSEFKNAILNRSMLTILSKLSGFSLGPFVFLNFQDAGFIFCSLSFLVAAAVQIFLYFKESDVERSVVSSASIAESFRNLSSVFLDRSFVVAAFLSGLLSIPLNPVFIEKLKIIGSTSHASSFWFFAGLSGLIATLVMKKTNILDKNHGLLFLTVSMVIMLTLAFNVKSPQLLILFSSLYVFCSIHFTVKTQVVAATSAKLVTLGSSVGAASALMDLGVFIGMVIGSFIHSLSFDVLLIGASGLLIARWMAFQGGGLFRRIGS